MGRRITRRALSAWLVSGLGSGLGALTAWAEVSPALPDPAADTNPQGSAPTLAQPSLWRAGADPQGYWVSEKLDGVRAYWDGQTLRTRSGHRVAVPEPWRDALPPTLALDGELWLDRGRFEAVAAVVCRGVADPQAWRGVRYRVFDAPHAGGPFEQRWEAANAALRAAGHPALDAVPQQAVADAPALQRALDAVLAQGGEGLVLHRRDAVWAPGRSHAVFKFKPTEDAEARVVGYLPGKGRHAGRVGALWVEQADGRRFALGSGLTDALREQPPAVGDWVSFRFRGRTSTGLPRFATFWRVRPPQ
ncbi:MAG: DNA ligase [Rhodoferax sp.]